MRAHSIISDSRKSEASVETQRIGTLLFNKWSRKMSIISVVVPIYKNEENLFPFLKEFMDNIMPAFQEQGDEFELILVNDDSPDNSWILMKEIATRDLRVKLLRLSRNFGAIPAAFAACSYASGDCIVVKACDLQEPSSLVVDMYHEWKRGEKIVLAVRERRSDSFFGDIASNLYYYFVRKFVDRNMPKGGFDIWLMDKEVKKHILQMNDKNSNIGLQLLWLGFHPKKVYYTRLKRKIGKSSWTLPKKIKLFIDSIIGFSYVPVRMMSMTGLLFVIFALLFGGRAVWARLYGLIDVQGYTTLLIIVLFSSGMIMFTLGILGEYIWRTLEASRNRPISVVRDAINFGEQSIGEGVDFRLD